VAQKLRDFGYKDVWALEGGFDAWRDDGLPLETKQRAA
jgi:rhodanese-related sulfurtransferase